MGLSTHQLRIVPFFGRVSKIDHVNIGDFLAEPCWLVIATSFLRIINVVKPGKVNNKPSPIQAHYRVYPYLGWCEMTSNDFQIVGWWDGLFLLLPHYCLYSSLIIHSGSEIDVVNSWIFMFMGHGCGFLGFVHPPKPSFLHREMDQNGNREKIQIQWAFSTQIQWAENGNRGTIGFEWFSQHSNSGDPASGLYGDLDRSH